MPFPRCIAFFLSLGALPALSAQTARLLNLSASGPVGMGSDVFAVGFSTSGGPEPILFRGIGPSLTAFGVPNAATQAQLSLFGPNSVPLASSASWAPGLAAVFAQVGAFPLQAGSADSALVQTLAPGGYSAQVTGTPVGSTVLGEIYDASGATPAGRLVNISARARAGTGAGVLSGGFVIGGSGSETVLLRGIGPTLGAFGVNGALAHPVLTLYKGSGAILAGNAGWGGDPNVASISAQVGAFALSAGSSDASMLATLGPGSYSAQVSAGDGISGVGLVEIYEVAPAILPVKKYHPGHYMMLSIGTTAATQRPLILQNLSDPNIAGFQICYTWEQLEPSSGDYSGIDSTIGADLALLAASGKQLVVQIQYKTKNLTDFPAYLRSTPSGLVLSPDGNYIPNLWDPSVGVQARYLALIRQIAAKYDAHPNLELVNMAETTVVDANSTLTSSPTYTAQAWVDAIQAVAVTAGGVFAHTTFEEYINHISGDDTLVPVACANAIAAGCVFGGPDIDPSRNNIPAYDSYPLFALTHHLGSAVQTMDYLMSGAFWYDSDHSQTTEHLFNFAVSPRLHVDYIFWLNMGVGADWTNAKATIDAHPWPWY